MRCLKYQTAKVWPLAMKSCGFLHKMFDSQKWLSGERPVYVHIVSQGESTTHSNTRKTRNNTTTTCDDTVVAAIFAKHWCSSWIFHFFWFLSSYYDFIIPLFLSKLRLWRPVCTPAYPLVCGRFQSLSASDIGHLSRLQVMPQLLSCLPVLLTIGVSALCKSGWGNEFFFIGCRGRTEC